MTPTGWVLLAVTGWAAALTLVLWAGGRLARHRARRAQNRSPRDPEEPPMPYCDGVHPDIRARACAALGHEDVGTGGLCPCTDDQLMADLAATVEALRASLDRIPVEARRRALGLPVGGR